jgi:hypothetical protein
MRRIVLAAALLLVPARGLCDEGAAKKPADTDARAAAVALFEEGNRLLGDADYPAALEKFRAAYARFPNPKLLLNIGTTLRQLGRNAEAAAAYEAYLRDPDASPARADEVRRVLADIDASVGRLRIEVSPLDAVVRVDSSRLEAAGGVASARVDVGAHVITVERAGMSTAVQNVTVAAREESRVTIRLTAPDKRPVIVVGDKQSPQRLAGALVGGLGAASIVAGAVTGGLALRLAHDVRNQCYGDSNRCSMEGVSLAAKTSVLADTSTITLAAGAGALVLGAVLFATAPRPKAPRAASLSVRLTVAPVLPGGAFLGVTADL